MIACICVENFIQLESEEKKEKYNVETVETIKKRNYR